MAQGAWVFGKDRPIDVLRAYRDYTVVDIADKVDCDVLLLAGEEDHFVPVEFLEYNKKALMNARSVKGIVYDKESGGQEHCQIGANALWQADFFSWLNDTF